MSEETTQATPPESAAPEAAAPAAPEQAAAAEGEKTEAQKPEEPIASAWAKLARQDKRIQEQRKALDGELKRVKDAEAAATAKAKELDDLLGLVETDPLAFFQALGKRVGKENLYELATAAALKAPKKDASEPIRKELDALKAKLQEREEAEKAAKAEGEKAFIESQFKQHDATCRALVSGAPEKYEAIRAFGAEAEIHALVIRHYEITSDEGNPVVLTPEQAADILEEHLTERLRSLPSLKKLQAAAGGSEKPAETPAPKERVGEAATSGGPRTLTNTVASEVASKAPRKLSEKERLARAIKLVGGT